ncbi:uncharacterized protein DNG_09376 [Cephalotrichum gorgonifer]|uniref:NB-ARC domain-containing protein n=1 Tax=Cephalotrichum gorgonifer TaxID=2041049 RepID=A0AAE8N6S4_9PEZI|nr:uncharacterized protein DNG_09376 [Cephalotrichum gorgonifer]
MLSLLSMGLAGNSNFLSSLERSSKDWHRISRDFVEPGEKLIIKSFYETLKTGNMIVVDEASATLNHSNEQTFPLHKNHRAICRFKDTEDNVFDLVGHAVLDVAKRFVKGELGLLRDTLDPSKPLMKGVVISGISGSGKTQLALQHIREYEDRYTAIIWINASSKGDIETSSASALEYLKTFWPNDRSIPTFPGQPPATSLIVRLRSTIYTKWLLVLDSADDPDALDFAKHLQLCKHGSVIVTSTRRSSADVFEKMSFEQQEIDSLDSPDGIRLLLSISNPTAQAQDNEHTELDDRRALPIVRELYGIPLALEQAGVLLRKRIVSLDTFIEQYRKQYHLLMTQQPTRGLISYEKNERSVVAILSMIYSSIKEESPPAAALLTCLGMLGPRKISSDVLRGFGSAWVKEKGGSYESTLGECLKNETQFRISIAYLLDICLVRRYDDSRNLQEHISVHGIICKWIVEMVLPQQTSDIPRIVEGVARVVRSDDGSPLAPYRLDYQSIDRGYLLVLRRCMAIMDSLVPEGAGRESLGVFNRISMHLGYILLSQAKYEDAIRKFNYCIETDRSQDPENWPSTQRALELLFGLSVALQKSGDLSQSRQTLASILPLAEKLFGNFDDRVAEISSRLKTVSDHEETNLQHHKRAVVGSTAKSDRAFGTSARTGEDQNEGGSRAAGSGSEEAVGSWSDSGSYVWSENDSDETRLQRAIETGDEAVVRRLIEGGADVEWRDQHDRTLLSQAAAAGHEAIVKLLLATGNFDLESRDRNGLTPLSRAASFGCGAVVRLLLATGKVDIESRDLGGWTPLSWAAVNGHEATIRQLVATGKVDVDSRDNNGRTPLSWAAVNGHEGVVRFLLGTGKVDVESADKDGRTPIDWATMYGREAVVELLTLAK